MEDRALQSTYSINPQYVFWELSSKLPDDAIVTSDSGTCASWYVRDLKFRPDMMDSLSGRLVSIRAAVPHVIATRSAHPGRPAITLMGDGAMRMSNMAKLITVLRYWKHWKSSKWTCMVLNGQNLNGVTWEQRVMEGDPKFPTARDISNVSYHRLAELIGLKGIYVDNPDQLAGAWDEALNADRPVVLEMRIDLDVSPLLPRVALQQIRNFTATSVYGDPDAGGVSRGTVRQMLPALFPVYKEQVHRRNAPVHAVARRSANAYRQDMWNAG